MDKRYEKKILESFELIEVYKKSEDLELYERIERILNQIDYIKVYFERMNEIKESK